MDTWEVLLVCGPLANCSSSIFWAMEMELVSQSIASLVSEGCLDFHRSFVMKPRNFLSSGMLWSLLFPPGLRPHRKEKQAEQEGRTWAGGPRWMVPGVRRHDFLPAFNFYTKSMSNHLVKFSSLCFPHLVPARRPLHGLLFPQRAL